MQVQADVDEADIGQVKVGQEAHFTVDAYPNRTFDGKVSQIRLQPQTTENVVSYTVMVDVDNPDLALLPGMTANITISVKEAPDVLKVPLAALKFIPPHRQGKWNFRHGGSGNDSGAARWAHANTGSGMHHRHHHGGQGEGQFAERQGDSGAGFRHAEEGDSTTHGRIFILVDGKPVRKSVTTGLRNSGYVEIEGDVKEGDQVIVGLLSSGPATATPPAASPFGGGPGGMRRF